jgi:hypothetical protein
MAAGPLILALLGGGLAYFVATKSGGWAPGDGPFDLMPEGVGSKPLETNTTYALSKRQYKITSYQRGTDQKFHVAVATTGGDWVSFLVDDKTGSRVLYRAHGSDQKALDALRGDFSL